LAGIEQPRQGFVQAGEATLCKKPYAVCDYPNGDVFVRHALQELQVKNTESLCISSMKHFLCTLYRRRCDTVTDTDVNSPTFGNPAVKPVCFEQCMDAYINCKFDLRHANLMCGEYIKAGWVSYQLDETRSDQCDNPAGFFLFAFFCTSPASVLTWSNVMLPMDFSPCSSCSSAIASDDLPANSLRKRACFSGTVLLNKLAESGPLGESVAACLMPVKKI